MIKMQAIGHLGKDAIVNNVNGKNVINFSIAHTEKFKDSQGNQKEKTQWVECAYWTDRTAIAPYLTKGAQVYVEGGPEVVTYPKNDGTTGTSLRLRVTNIQLLGGGQKDAAKDQQTYASAGPNMSPATQVAVEDLPF